MRGFVTLSLWLLWVGVVAAQSPLLDGLRDVDWRRRNAAAAQACARASHLTAAEFDGLWELADESGPFTWAALPTRRTMQMDLHNGAVLQAIERIPAVADFVPRTPGDLVMPCTPQVLALLVLLHAGLPTSRENLELAVETATRATEPAEFALACELCAALGAPAREMLTTHLHDKAAGEQGERRERLLQAGTRVLSRLGAEGRADLRGLLAPDTALPLRRAALLALQDLAPEHGAPALREVAIIFRHDPELAPVALGTLLAHRDGAAVIAAIEAVAEGLQSEDADQRQRCGAALAAWNLAGTARSRAAALLQAHLATCPEADFGIVVGALRAPIATPIAPATFARLLATANGPSAGPARASRACLAEAARQDDACLAALLGASGDCLPWLTQAVLDTYRQQPLAEELFAVALAVLRPQTQAQRLTRLRLWQRDHNFCAEPAVQRLLLKELDATAGHRADDAARFVAQYCQPLAGLTPAVERLLHASPEPSAAVWSAWVRLQPDQLPHAIRAGLTTSWAVFEVRGFPGRSDPQTRQALLELALDSQLEHTLRHRAAAWLATMGASAAELLATLVGNRDAATGLWALHGLRKCAKELVGDRALGNTLEATLRAGLARGVRGHQTLATTAALFAIERLQPDDLEAVVAQRHTIPPARWRSAGLTETGDLDIRSVVDAWDTNSLVQALEDVGAAPRVLESLAQDGCQPLRETTPPVEDTPERAARRRLGKLALRR
ncbi:MAG: hypothetical protein JNK49_19780 [Planctomycetes bacterium]|nr:hypothetical protein [Planctomycetota bacterium]